MTLMHDVIVIGAGPVGLACAIEARREGLQAAVIEKGALVNSIVGYPANMEFFSTPELIEIGGYPFPVQGYKPTREEAIEYYRGVTQREAIDLHLYERVLEVRGDHGDFTVVTTKDAHAARNIVVSTGLLRPAEPHERARRGPAEGHPLLPRALSRTCSRRWPIIGARNSAAKAALDCYRHGAQVTMIVRSPELSDKIKYWIKPDLENRIKEGSIKALFNATVREIREGSLLVDDRGRRAGRSRTTGCSRRRAITRITASSNNSASSFETMAFARPSTTRRRSKRPGPGVYIAGTVCGGYQTSRWFIENGRFHARQIAKHIARGRTERVQFEKIHWKTEE